MSSRGRARNAVRGKSSMFLNSNSDRERDCSVQISVQPALVVFIWGSVVHPERTSYLVALLKKTAMRSMNGEIDYWRVSPKGPPPLGKWTVFVYPASNRVLLSPPLYIKTRFDDWTSLKIFFYSLCHLERSSSVKIGRLGIVSARNW